MTVRPELTVVGAINLDLTARVRRAPERGETVADGILTRQSGGKGANQAAAAARLGARVRLIGAIGDDPDGIELRRALDSAGVDTTQVQVVEAATGTALIVIDATGENSIVVCPGANLQIDVRRMTVDPHAPVISQLEVPIDVVAHVATQTDGFFVLNPSPARALPSALAQRVDLFIVNEGEYAQLPEVHAAPLVALTLGADGAVLYRDGTEIARARATAARVTNTVGAGDAFAAALTLGLIRGDEPAVALQRACAVGAAAVADDRSQPDFLPLTDYPGAPR
ncbi:PfkB family carbohydrate kinase [Microbacterium pumilum]|uniref:Ribokinase n=1 Tax=Microbacterium pumilum TaxID=344165 RepID=A0ABP5DM46_9MICO